MQHKQERKLTEFYTFPIIITLLNPDFICFRSGHAEVIRVILEKDKNAIFDKDEDEQTPLHIGNSKLLYINLIFMNMIL